MSLKDQMEASVKDLGATHEVNRKAYREARAAKLEAESKMMAAKEKASVSANELGAAQKALEELSRNSPSLEAVGEVGG